MQTPLTPQTPLFPSSKEGRRRTPLLGYRHFCEVRDPGAANLLPRTMDYCNSFKTSCCWLLACAKAEMPVWLRISYLDMFEVAEA
jgi:hypothetical protein